MRTIGEKGKSIKLCARPSRALGDVSKHGARHAARRSNKSPGSPHRGAAGGAKCSQCTAKAGSASSPGAAGAAGGRGSEASRPRSSWVLDLRLSSDHSGDPQPAPLATDAIPDARRHKSASRTTPRIREASRRAGTARQALGVASGRGDRRPCGGGLRDRRRVRAGRRLRAPHRLQARDELLDRELPRRGSGVRESRLRVQPSHLRRPHWHRLRDSRPRGRAPRRSGSVRCRGRSPAGARRGRGWWPLGSNGGARMRKRGGHLAPRRLGDPVLSPSRWKRGGPSRAIGWLAATGSVW